MKLFSIGILLFLYLFVISHTDDIESVGLYYHKGIKHIKLEIKNDPFFTSNTYKVYFTKRTTRLLNIDTSINHGIITFSNVVFVSDFNLLFSYDNKEINFRRNSLLMQVTFNQIQFTESSDKTYDVSFNELDPKPSQFSDIDLIEFKLYQSDYYTIKAYITSIITSDIQDYIRSMVRHHPLCSNELAFRKLLLDFSGESGNPKVYQCDGIINEYLRISNFSVLSSNYDSISKDAHFGTAFLKVRLDLKYTITTYALNVYENQEIVVIDKITYMPGRIEVSDEGTGDEALRYLIKEKLIILETNS